MARRSRKEKSDRDFAVEAEACVRRGNVAAAERTLQIGLRRFPESAGLLVELGNLDLQRGLAGRAERRYRRALHVAPDDAAAWGALAMALKEQARLDEAIAACRASLKIAPGSPQVLYNLGIALRENGDLEEAVEAYDRALAAAPGMAAIWYNRANALSYLGDHDTAIASYDEALALEPDYAEAELSKSIALLLRGDFAAGWDLAERRFAARGFDTPDRTAPFPRWNGEDLAGRTVVVWGEQGIGDEIRYLTCLPDLAATAGRVIYDCAPRLETLARRSFPGVEVRPSPPKSGTVAGPADFHAPIGSLARHFRRSMDDFGSPRPILRPDGAAVEHWRRWLSGLGPGITTGVSWRSGSRELRKQLRYAPLSAWEGFFRTPGVQFVCLQYDDCADEIAAIARDFGVGIHVPPDLDRRDDFENLAALDAALDVVVSCPNTVADLSGSVGTTTLVIAHGPHWPWGIWPGAGIGGQMWYPELAMISARAYGGWVGALSEAARRLEAQRGAA